MKTESVAKARNKSWKEYARLRPGDKVKIVHNPGVHSEQTYIVTDVRLGAEPLYELGGFHHSLPRQKLKKVASKGQS
jgi:hypothetical protein